MEYGVHTYIVVRDTEAVSSLRIEKQAAATSSEAIKPYAACIAPLGRGNDWGFKSAMSLL